VRLTVGVILPGMNARKSTAAVVLCAGLLPLAPRFVGSAPPAQGGTPASAAAPAAQQAVPPSSDAAKHAKRTACIKDAKTKKLVGAEKNSYIKSCTEAP